MLRDLDQTAQRVRVFRRGELLASGYSPTGLTRAVRRGAVLRPRGGAYLHPETAQDVVDAVRVGGRLACVSELARLGVYVRDSGVLHVHLSHGASRLRDLPRAARRHWRPLHRCPHPADASVEVFDALIQAIGCQDPADAVATIDSALHLRLLRADELDELFRHVDARKRHLRGLVDGRSEAGTETLVRLMLRAFRVTVDLQVVFVGVGRVDLVVDDWLVIECDSRAHHSEWEAQRRDRRRDQALAARGYCVYRPIAEDILYRPESVVAALRGLLGRPRRRPTR
ncbi:type IV toxin-antitoxin system AbiEi family antitoxin domain-containing protein [Microbacterium sp. Sa4CUA7]|uniref:Type IV toxin-antitoxin system AbiEi family antitoxin domain-containing protein n=1 Tax=Microbacterium pullorum TaxID=2762236 RepID=A0ABR8RYY7_9MICO|nr:type IV toxin-antitoxin system AbiEi family antitoxin domain-containing protein [Microbacterium pullorum]MBD7956455.1 type IV toxin-antitoxin system AbiEi family antitoxin domain-containing protein [Microbacterium pullorum]